MKLTPVLLMLLICGFQAVAQNVIVKGMVVDNTGELLTGVNVIQKN